MSRSSPKTTRKKPTTKMIRTTISLPSETYKKLGHLAVDDEKGLSELMTEAIIEYIQRREKSR